jgi:hypothetical protein
MGKASRRRHRNEKRARESVTWSRGGVAASLAVFAVVYAGFYLLIRQSRPDLAVIPRGARISLAFLLAAMPAAFALVGCFLLVQRRASRRQEAKLHELEARARRSRAHD